MIKEKLKAILDQRNRSTLLSSIDEKAKDLESMNMESEEMEILYKNFVNKHKNDPYFELRHVTEAFPNCDLYLILTKRGAGKTHQFTMMIDECIRSGKEFVLIRNSSGELQQGAQTKFEEFNRKGTYWNGGEIRIDAKNGKIWLREYYLDGKGNGKYLKKVVGYCAHLNSNFSSLQGASYDNVGVVIWDEATNGGQGINDLPRRLNRIRHLYCSLDRGKGIPIYAFGNLLDATDDKGNLQPCDYLMRALGIDSSRNLFVGERLTGYNGKNGTRLCYINTRDLYWKADDTIKGLGVFSSREYLKALGSNTPVSANHNVVSELTFMRAENIHWGVVRDYKNKYYIVQLASYGDSADRIYIINVTPLSRSALSVPMKVYSDDPTACSIFYEMLTYRETCAPYWFELKYILSGKKVLYVGDESVSLMFLLYGVSESYINEYMQMVEKLKPKKSRRK